MGKLEKLPFKVLFYLGFIIVIIFLGLSYWQISSHYDDTNNLESLTQYENLLEVSISDVNNLSEFQYIQIDETTSLLNTWLLRSRVHNGQNGYNRIDLISDNNNNYMIVNRGWVPLDFNLDSIDKFEDFKYKNETDLTEKFTEDNDFCTNVRGVKVRGVYDTKREADVRAKVLQRQDKHHSVFVGQVGYWLPWDPSLSYLDKVEGQYLDNDLNTKWISIRKIRRIIF